MGHAVIGAYEAKTHFSQLLERVRAGEQFAVTKNGVEIALIVPSDQTGALRRRQAAKALRQDRPTLGGGWVEQQKWRDEGRR